MTIITIRVPDDTARLLYTEMDENGAYETDPKNVTAGMIVKVEREQDLSALATVEQAMAKER